MFNVLSQATKGPPQVDETPSTRRFGPAFEVPFLDESLDLAAGDAAPSHALLIQRLSQTGVDEIEAHNPEGMGAARIKP